MESTVPRIGVPAFAGMTGKKKRSGKEENPNAFGHSNRILLNATWSHGRDARTTSDSGLEMNGRFGETRFPPGRTSVCRETSIRSLSIIHYQLSIHAPSGETPTSLETLI